MTNSKQELREKIVANLTKSVKEFKVAFEGGEPGYDFEPFVDEMVDTVKSEVNKALIEVEGINLKGMFIDLDKTSGELVAEHRGNVQAAIEQARKRINNA